MSSSCSTDELLPQWLSIGFICGAILVLLFVSFLVLKQIRTPYKTITTSPASSNAFKTAHSSSSTSSLKPHTAEKVQCTTNKPLSPPQTPSTPNNDEAKEKGNDIMLEIEAKTSMSHRFDLSSSASSPNTGIEETSKGNEEGAGTTKGISPWDEASCGGIFVLWAKEFWHRKGIYAPIMAHIADTSTDIASVVEFGIIGSTFNAELCGGLNVWWLMIVSLSAMIIYRIISSWIIWRITRSKWRIFMQLIDIEIFNLVYFGHRMELKGASSPQRLVSVLEAVFEAAPQAVLQTLYLVKTGSLSPVIIASSIMSLVNLTNTLITDDKKFLEAEFSWPWKNNDVYKDNDDCLERETKRKTTGFYKFKRLGLIYTFRLFDVPSQILSFVMVWNYCSGYILFIIMVVDTLIVGALYFVTNKTTDALLSIIAIPHSFGKKEHMLYLIGFWCWSVWRTIGIILLIWLSIDYNHFPEKEPAFIIALLVFTSIGLVFRFIIFGILLICVDNFKYVCKTKERGDLAMLLKDQYYDDAAELLFYTNFNLHANAKTLHGDRLNRHSLLGIVSGTTTPRMFDAVLEAGLDDGLDDDDEKNSYWTALMVAVRNKKKDWVSAILTTPNMSRQYLMRAFPHRHMANYEVIFCNTALYYAIEGCDDDDDGLEILEELLKWIKTLESFDIHYVLDNTVVLRFKSEFMNIMAFGSDDHQSALHVAIDKKVPLSVFRMLYLCYPDEYKHRALENLVKKGVGADVVALVGDDENLQELKLFVEKQQRELDGEILEKETNIDENNESKDEDAIHEQEINDIYDVENNQIYLLVCVGLLVPISFVIILFGVLVTILFGVLVILFGLLCFICCLLYLFINNDKTGDEKSPNVDVLGDGNDREDGIDNETAGENKFVISEQDHKEMIEMMKEYSMSTGLEQ